MLLSRTSFPLAVALMAAGGAFAQELPAPQSPAVPSAAAPGAARVPLLTSSEGDGVRPAVRLIRDGAVVATGTLAADGGLNGNDLPPGVYTVAGTAGGAFALFSHQITTDDPDESSLQLLAPAADRPLALALLARRFPEAFPAPSAGQPQSALPKPETSDWPVRLNDADESPFRPAARRLVTNAALKRAGGVTPGATGAVRQFDAGGVARPVPGAEVFLIRNGQRVASLTTDDAGAYRLPKTLAPGLYTLVTVNAPAVAAAANADAAALYGASVTGLNVVAARPVVQNNGNPFRTVARRVVQPPPFGPPTVPASDIPAVFGPGTDDDDPFGPPIADGFAGGGGGGAGGGGGFGGALIPALIGAGIGAAIAAGSDDDDPVVPAGSDPQPMSPAAPSGSGIPTAGSTGSTGDSDDSDD